MNRRDEYPGFWHAVLLCVIFIALQFILIIPVAILDAAFKTRLVTHPAVLGVINLSACALMITTGWLIGRPAMSEVFSLRRVSAPALGSVIVSSAGAIILLSEVDNLVRFILPPPEWIARIFNDLTAPSQHFWASVFLLVIVAPLTEEVMFRGLMLRAFLQRFRGGSAFLLSSLLFGAVHLNPWQFVSAFALGLMFAWWYARTRSLVPCLLGHALANAMVVGHGALPFKVRGFNAGDPFAGADLQPAWFDALGVLLLATGLWLFRRATRAACVRVESPSEQMPPPVPPGPDASSA
jgi:membrane protease YdiL (CAAX protease family)